MKNNDVKLKHNMLGSVSKLINESIVTKEED